MTSKYRSYTYTSGFYYTPNDVHAQPVLHKSRYNTFWGVVGEALKSIAIVAGVLGLFILFIILAA